MSRPSFWRYFKDSAPAKARETLAANIPLFARCLDTHGELIEASGADHLIARNGWIAGYRTDAGLRAAEERRAELSGLGIDAAMLSPSEIAVLEPHLEATNFLGAVHFRDPWTVNDPGALTKAYAAQFEKEGGVTVIGDAAQPYRWEVATARHHRRRTSSQWGRGRSRSSTGSGSACRWA